MELTEQQAREELSKLEEDELRRMATERGKPTDGLDKEALINVLMGYCPGCKGGSITVVYIGLRGENLIQKAKEKPCSTCPK